MKITFLNARSSLHLILFALLLISGCQLPEALQENRHSYVSISKNQFLDTVGRNLVLHGLNLVNKDPEQGYLGSDDRQVFSRMKEWGFNCVRLGVIWDGLEPDPGVYDEEYLKGIDERIQWAAEQGVYVILDMHQDLFSVLFSDGAPEWATITDDKPHITGEVWSEAYMISPAVQTAFDNFWTNAPAPDGKGVQDHFIDAWRYLAERYAGSKHVVGYDLMNEPFPGTPAREVFPAMLRAYGELMVERGESPPSEEYLAELWSSTEGKARIYNDLGDTAVFAHVFDAAYPIQASFEREVLTGFYQKIRDAIRKVDPHHILFIEHSLYGNSGVLSAIQPLKDAEGRRDALVAYAPHGYDLVVDTDNQEVSSLSRVRFIFDRIHQTGQRLDMPVLVGEWGAFYANEHPAVTQQAGFITQIFEEKVFSDTYWSYFPGISDMPYFTRIRKPYPMAVSGELLAYAFRPETGTLEVSWKEKPGLSGPTRIYVHDLEGLELGEVHLNPESAYRIEPITGTGSGYLLIPPEDAMTRKLLRIIFK